MWITKQKPGPSVSGKGMWKRYSSLHIRRALATILSLMLFLSSSATIMMAPAMAQVADQAGVSAVDAPVPGIAPMNPAFIAYQQAQSLKPLMLKSASGNPTFSTGLIPEPVNHSIMGGESIDVSLPGITDPGVSDSRMGAGSNLGLPQAYDLRTMGKLTAVRDQSSSGSCWAFASYASLESYLLPAESRDFSENNLKNRQGFDYGPNSGGNRDMAAAYLTRWEGPVNETDDPYNPLSTTSLAKPAQKHVQDVLYIPDRVSSLDNDNIKNAIMNYGAIYSSFYIDQNSYYSAASHAYYYNNTASDFHQPNHAIALVGWNDSYSKNNFGANTPPGDGAFIVKNSWGAGWGESGYFYISYYDHWIGRENAVFTAEQLDNYGHIYQHDPLGSTGAFGYGGDTGWFAATYTAAGKEVLSAAGFYTMDVNSNYQVRVLKNGVLVPSATKSGTIASAGYHTIRLDSPVPLNANDRFQVQVQVQTPGEPYPIAIERPLQGYSSNAKANASESYVSNDGSQWTDITGYIANTDVCLKAYTSDPVAVSPTIVNVSRNAGVYAPASYSVTLKSQPTANVIITPSACSNISITPASLLFTAANWNTPQSFTVNVSATAAANNTSIIMHTATSNDPFYSGLAIASVTANVTVSSSGVIQFSQAAYSVRENASSITVTVSRTGNLSVPSSVSYGVTGGNATQGADYTGGTGALSFGANVASATFSLNIQNDNVYEGNETILLALSNPINATMGTNSTTMVSITDDEAPPTVQFNASAYAVNESTGSLCIRVLLNGSTVLPASVDYAVTGGNATQGSDFTGGTGTLTFAPGTTDAWVNLTIINDSTYEGNETIVLALTNPVNAGLGLNTTATATILNDDLAPQQVNTTLNLTSGWNLISIPLVLQSNDISSIFPANVRDGIVDIWGWDEATQNWAYYSPDPNDYFYQYYPALTQLNAGKAYWVEMNKSASVAIHGTVPGYAPASQTTIGSGWNFVSSTGMVAQDVTAMYPGAIDVWGWDEATQNWAYYSPDPNDYFYQYYPRITYLQPGHGYWVEMT